LKDYVPGLIIALIIYIILELVNRQIYNNVMSLSIVFSILVSYVIISKHNKRSKDNISIKRKISGHIAFCLILIVCVYFSLPGLTFNQAKEKVLNNHDITIGETYIVPLYVDDEWDPFITRLAYFFEGRNSRGNKISIMVIPDTGKVFVMD
jgi:hypothetical protein